MSETEKLFDAYESIRSYLPCNIGKNKKATLLKSTKELTQAASCFFLDAYGILNVGNRAIKGASNFLEQLNAQNIPYLILSNAASISKLEVCKRFDKMGFCISPDSIITSREVLFHILRHSNEHWGIIANSQKIEHTFEHTFNEEKEFFQSERFLFLSSKNWNVTLHEKWLKKFEQKPFEIWVANPDLTSPQENGNAAKEPGSYTLLEPSIIQKARFIGKPFPEVFQYAIDIAKRRWAIDEQDIMMVGDTLHTDILGANAIGLKSALIEGYGFFKDHDTESFMQRSGIYPDVRLKEYC